MWINCCGVWKGGTELGGNLEGVLGYEAKLSDLSLKIFLGDSRLAEIWLTLMHTQEWGGARLWVPLLY